MSLLFLGSYKKISNSRGDDPRRPNLVVSTLDEFLQIQGSQSTPGDAKETPFDVHVVLQREEGADSEG